MPRINWSLSLFSHDDPTDDAPFDGPDQHRRCQPSRIDGGQGEWQLVDGNRDDRFLSHITEPGMGYTTSLIFANYSEEQRGYLLSGYAANGDSLGWIASTLPETFLDGEFSDSSSEQSAEFEEAVELVQRLTEASPDNAMDVAVAVVEAVPDSAAYVATEYAEHLSETELISDQGYDEAVELVQRLSEASPDYSMDVAVAVVEVMPESASEMVDAISEGDESVEGELSNLMTDKPDTY